MKHIESIQPEVAAYDLERIFREEGDATATAALTRLLHDWTGCDIPVTDDTPQSEVEELVPLAVSILRRHWQTPLTCLSASVADRHPNGDMGAEPLDLADLMRQLIGDRVQGNEALGILPANDNIPTAVAALRERKIGGVSEAPDGVSLPHLLCDSTIPPITELIDDNIGWVMDKNLNLTNFPTVESLVLGAERIEFAAEGTQAFTAPNIKEITMPHLTEIRGSISSLPNAAKINMPKVTKIYVGYGGGCNCVEMLMPSLTTTGGSNIYRWWQTDSPLVMKKMVVGSLTSGGFPQWSKGRADDLLHFELGADGLGGCKISLDLSWWTATNVISDPSFLSNFRLYIADRLSDNGSGKTLTLSQEVRDAIHAAGIDTIITNKGWTISPVPTQQ